MFTFQRDALEICETQPCDLVIIYDRNKMVVEL